MKGKTMKVKVFTLGCKVNQFESQAMLRTLEEKGYQAVPESESSDVTIVNSCAVTAASEQKAVKLLNRIRREDPDTVILLTGCMAQTQDEGSSKLKEADIILGNKRRNDIVPVLDEFFANRKKLRSVEEFLRHDDYEDLAVYDFSERTRAFLKIEDGCNRFCSYCIIPYARGRVRSSSLEYIKKEIQGFAANGYREVVLVGINLSSFGSDNGLSFADAVRTACEAADIRIRLGSLEPESMDIDTLRVFAEYDNFCPQFHLSLQSGCDSTLKRMNRHYTTAEYEKIVSDIRTVFDNPSITTDVMVGFAGETEEEFVQSAEFIEKIGFARTHIFPYSRRPGTAADKAAGQLSNDIKKKRAARMAEYADRARRNFLDSQLGRVEKVLFETGNKDGMYEGYTPNYTLVYAKADKGIVNKIADVRLISVVEDHIIGEII